MSFLLRHDSLAFFIMKFFFYYFFSSFQVLFQCAQYTLFSIQLSSSFAGSFPIHKYDQHRQASELTFLTIKSLSKRTETIGYDSRKLDALIYDGPVLQYEVLQDANGTCQLLIEGSWYAHTGYGLAFPRHSKYLQLFNKNLMEYKESGEL